MSTAHSALPGSLPEIADHIGRDAACAIALAYGGRNWRVPSRLDSMGGHGLAACVGKDAARTLIAAFGGHVLDIPMARRQVVSWLARRNLTAAQIAERLQITERSARRYIGQSGKSRG